MVNMLLLVKNNTLLMVLWYEVVISATHSYCNLLFSVSDIPCFSAMIANCHGPAGVPRLATRCLCVLSTWLVVCLVPCAPMSIVCPLPSCYLIIVSVAPAVSPLLPSFVSLYSLLVSAVLCWSVVFHVSMSCELNVWLCSSLLPACLFFPFGVVYVLLFHFIIKTLISSAFHLTWQNGSAKMRTQQRRGLGRPPPDTISSPLYQRILQYEALSSCRQQGNDVRSFAMEFSGAAEGLGYNDEALKDLFNSALDEPLSWWRMSGLDHLTFRGIRWGFGTFPS